MLIQRNLCSRIDLNPSQATGDEGEREGRRRHNNRGNRTTTSSERRRARHHRGLTALLHETLNAGRMHEASPEERMAALRLVRGANRQRGRNTEENAEERQQRGLRLAGRLRDQFRIRTRQHGHIEGQQES